MFSPPLNGTSLIAVTNGTTLLRPGRWVARATSPTLGEGVRLIAFRIRTDRTVTSCERQIADERHLDGVTLLAVRRTGDA